MVQYVRDARKLAYETTITTENLEACVRGQEIELAFIVDITSADGGIAWHYSNRHIDVAGTFYEGRLKTPQLTRRMTELFTPDIELTEVTFEIWAGDDALNDYLPTGSLYSPLIGATCVIKIGFPQNPASFTSLFYGVVHFEGAMQRNREYIVIRARDKITYKLLSNPNLIRVGNNSSISQSNVAESGMCFPWVGKKYSTTIANPAELLASNSDTFMGLRCPVYTMNGFDGFAYMEITPQTASSAARKFAQKDALLNTTSAGTYSIPSTTLSGRNVLAGFYTASQGKYENYYDDYLFESISTGTAVRNYAVYIAGLSTAEIMTDAEMQTLFSFDKMDIICDDAKRTNASYLASWAKQSGLDMWISADSKLKFSSFFTASMPTLSSMRRITNQSISEDSLGIEVERNNLLTAANATYAYSFFKKQTSQSTRLKYQQAAEIKYGKRIAKTIDFPSIANSESQTNVETHLDKYIRLMCAGLEYITLELTYDWITLELGDWVKLYITAQAADFRDTPAQVRSIAYNLDTGTVTVKLLSYANFISENYTPNNNARCFSGYAYLVRIAQ
jgi:hypothetical protein